STLVRLDLSVTVIINLPVIRFLLTSLPSRPIVPLFSLLTRPPPTSTLFPYTTLFRSPYSFDGTAALQQMPGAVVFARDTAHVSEIGRDTSELQSPDHLVCRLLLEKKKKNKKKQKKTINIHQKL